MIRTVPRLMDGIQSFVNMIAAESAAKKHHAVMTVVCLQYLFTIGLGYGGRGGMEIWLVMRLC